jgi:uncharacterized protein (DUF4213/DUF364 family)
MLPENTIAKRIVEFLHQEAEKTLVKDICIGLGFTAVQLEDNRTGLAAVLREEIGGGCTTLSEAGTLKGKNASYLLEMLLRSESVVSKSLGLATANSILSGRDLQGIDRRDTIELIKLIPEDRVAMVGLFRPLVSKIKSITSNLTIIEKERGQGEVVSLNKGKTALKDCTVALITASSILNSTLEDILNSLGSTRRVVLLGPSTPLATEIFFDTPINHLAGSWVIDPEKVLQIVSEGGGTMIMRPYLDFINRIF